MANNGRIAVAIDADTRNFDSGLKKTSDSLNRLTSSLRKTAGSNATYARATDSVASSADKATRSSKNYDSALSRVSGSTRSFAGTALKLGGVLGSVFAAVKIKDYVKDAVGQASDLNEAGTAVQQVFGSATKSINKFADGGAAALGMTKLQTLQAAQTFGVYGKAAGLAGDQNADFSKKLVGLSTDLASFYNVDPQEAADALAAGLRGESEPLRKYGILLDDATLKAEALSQGIYSGKGPLTQQQKILAAQAVIMKQSSVAQGDFARTSGGLANQQRILAAQLTDVKAKLGVALLPVLKVGAQVLTGLVLPAVSALADKAAPAIEKFLKPLENMQPVIQKIKDAFSGGGGPFGAFIAQVGSIFSNLSPLGALFKGLLPVLSQLASALAPVAAAFGGALTQTITALAQAVLPVFVSLLSTVATALTNLLPALTPLITMLGSTLTQVFSAIAPYLQTFVSGLGQILPVLGQAFTALMPTIQVLVGALGQVFGAVLQAAVPIIKTVASVLAQLVPVIAPIVQTLASALGPVLQAILPLFTVLGKAVQQLLPAIVPLISVLASVFGTVMQAAIPIVKTLAGILAQLVPVITPIISTLASALAPILQAVMPLITMLGGVIQQLLPVILPVVSAIATMLTGALKILMPILTQVVQILITALKPVFAALTPIVAALTPILGTIAQLFVSLLSAIAPLLVPIAKLVGALLQPLAALLANLVPPILGLVNVVLETLTPILTTLVGVIVKVITAVVEVATSFAQLSGKVYAAVTKVIAVVIGWISDLVKKFGGIQLKIVKVFAGAVGWLVDVGKNIVQGLLKGAGSLLTTVGKFFLDKLPSFIREPFKKALGIHSPSREFAGYGMNTVQGFVNGVKNSKSVQALKAAMTKLSDLVKKAFDDKRINKSTKDSLLKTIDSQNKKLTSLASAREKIAQKIADASAFAADTKKSIVDAGTIATGGAFSDITRNLKGVLANSQAFKAGLSKLTKLGLNKTALSQLIAQFTQDPASGLATMKAILGAGSSGISTVNSYQSKIAGVAKSVGEISAQALFDTTKLKLADKTLLKQMDTLGTRLARAVSRGLNDAVAAATKTQAIKTTTTSSTKSSTKGASTTTATGKSTATGDQPIQIVINIEHMTGGSEAALGREVVKAIAAYKKAGGRVNF